MNEKMVQNHEKTLVEHEEALGKLQKGQGLLTDEMIGIKRNVAGLADTVSKLSAKQAEEEEPAFSWYTNTSKEQAELHLGELEWFVNSVLVHVHDGVLNDCWRRHPQVVDMLLVLTEGYQFAWRGKVWITARLDFYTRYLPEVMRQVTGILGTCSLNDPRHGESQRPARQRGIDSFEDFEMAWRLERGDPPIPTVPAATLHESRSRGSESERDEMNK